MRLYDESFKLTHQYVTYIEIFNLNTLSQLLIAAWEVGLNGIISHEDIDYFTEDWDLSSDIIARAQFFAKNGYE